MHVQWRFIWRSAKKQRLDCGETSWERSVTAWTTRSCYWHFLLQTCSDDRRHQAHVNKSSAFAEMGDRDRAKWVEKWGTGVPLSVGGGLGPHLTQCIMGRGLPPYEVTAWFIQPFGHNTPTYGQTGQAGQRSHSIGRTVSCNDRPKTEPAAHMCV